ncbi:MAG: phosphatase PAP2 family protein [Clostridia bacterium]|nr:phosphatase PAP2 family protein [Clostridia bacterium]
MKKPTVDYSGFRLSRLKEPRFSHLLLLLGWVGYFLLYFLTETFIPAERCHPMHCFLDDLIPFCEVFLLAYGGWYLLVFGSLLHYLLYDVESFKKLQYFIIITQVVAMAVYILYPTRQDLRPEFFARDNGFTRILGFIYSMDTSTGVCPSLHVAYSLGIASVCYKDKNASLLKKILITATVILISLSTMFVKQHSAVDVLAALILGLAAELIVYGKYWRRRLFDRRS